MQEESQIQELVSQNISQGGSAGNAGISSAQDIANSYGDSETDQEELQSAPEGEEIDGGDKKLQKNRARWEKILKERKQDRELIKSLQEKSEQFESKEFQSAAMLRDLLKSRPQYASMLLRLFNGENPQQVVNEIFRQEQRTESAQQRPAEEEYDERTASYFKEIEELKRWKQGQESEREAFMKEQVHNYQRDLDVEYERRLAEDGFLDQHGQPVDDTYVSLIDSATKAILQTSAKNPDIPTSEEFDRAYSTMKQCIKYMEDKIRRDMSKKSVSDVPPLSGTSSGQMPIGKSKMTEHDRIMDVANSFFV